MTAIVGFNCADGVVLAADSEESYGDSNKVFMHKLFPFTRSTWKACIAGSGPGYLIDYAKDKIIAAIHAGLKNETEFHAALDDILDGLYEKEFKKYPASSQFERSIQLLVGIQFANESDPSAWTQPGLFECQANLVTKVKPLESRVLGVGEIIKELAAQFASWRLPTDLAEWASIYIIYEAKRRFGGVGGKTHTFMIMKDGKYVDRFGGNIPEKEQILDILPRVNQLLALSLSPSLTDAKSKDLVDAARRWLSVARREVQRIERQQGKQKHKVIVIGDSETDRMIKLIAKLSSSEALTPSKEN